MMEEHDIKNRVHTILIEEFEIDEHKIDADATLFESLGLDSLDSVDLVVALEKEFGFKVVRSKDEETIRSIRQVKDVYDFVEHKLNGKS